MVNTNRTLLTQSCSAEFAGFGALSAETVGVIGLLSSLIIILSSRLYTKWQKDFRTKAGDSKWKRKREFLLRVGDEYGYQGTNGGFIDDWRPKELPNLQLPVLKHQQSSDRKDDYEREIYLDYAGSALPTASQLRKAYTNTSSILANPHSTGPAASRTVRGIEEVKKRILKYYCAAPGRFASLENPPSSFPQVECHPGYEILFTSGTTEALKTIAERFPWTQQCDRCGRTSILLYAQNSHSSVVGMRELVLNQGAAFQCYDLERIRNMTKDDFASLERRFMTNESGFKNDCRSCKDKKIRNLLVFSAECNFGGSSPDYKSIIATARESGWFTMLDIAKAASTLPIVLREANPDFASMSFYKIFGEPTGLGSLFVKRSSIPLLFESVKNKRHYVGGGTVNLLLVEQDYLSQTESVAALKSGTSHFRGILSLSHGFDELDRLGGMVKIHQHTMTLAKELSRRLRGLFHGNGRPAVVLYGPWGTVDNVDSVEAGPTVTLNVMRDDGSFVGYNEVSKLAELNKPSIQFRIGCFCNPGACQQALNLNDEQLIHNFEIAGHVCGDHMDIIDDRPTGAIRISFGKDSIWEDLDEFITFLQRNFVSNSTDSSKGKAHILPRATQVTLAEMYIFPIKSCAAQRVSRWKVDVINGKLLHDREFALVDASGTALRLQSFPKMGMISPVIDLENLTMIVKAPGCCDLVLNLVENDSCGGGGNSHINVCGNKCNGILWGGYKASEWFSSFLGVQCWLARYPQLSTTDQRRSGFANDQPLLLISNNAVQTLNHVLAEQNQNLVGTKHFRPNLVVNSLSNNNAYFHIEDEWERLHIPSKGLTFEARGSCARCSMVDFDPQTGQKGKTLRALAKYRRQNGSITFGIFMKAIVTDKNCQRTEIWLEEGVSIICF